jgi:hypothetical protein
LGNTADGKDFTFARLIARRKTRHHITNLAGQNQLQSGVYGKLAATERLRLTTRDSFSDKTKPGVDRGFRLWFSSARPAEKQPTGRPDGRTAAARLKHLSFAQRPIVA